MRNDKSEKLRKKIIATYKRLHNMQKTAVECGCSRTWVSKVVNKHLYYLEVNGKKKELKTFGK